MTYNVKTGNEKNTIWITMIRHGGSGHEVQESWPLVALRTESREERIFSSGINCMSVVRVREKKNNLNRGPIMQ